MSPGQTGRVPRDRWDVSPGQTGRTPGGVPPKLFMFIGFFLSPAIFPTRERENGLFKEKPSTKAISSFSRGKNRISQGDRKSGLTN